MDAARELAQLLQGAPQLVARRVQQRPRGAVVAVLQPALGQPELQRKGDQPLLSAVVQVALEAAIEALAERAALPVSLGEMPAERLPPPVEAAAYFVVAEALTNVTKYASASQAEVRIARNGGYAVVEVHDDGVGGADPATGTGLRGLADRLAALDGRLEVHSPPGEGTTVRAEVPCG